MSKHTKSPQIDVKQLRLELESVRLDLIEARGREQRALADYQNLVRRTREDRSKVAKIAGRDFIESLLEPFEHLSLAAEQLKDPGINMVVTELWQALASQGLQEIEAMGKKFDVNTMEVVERVGDGDIVVKVIRRGYMLNGEVIQHAKVVVGEVN